MATKMTIARAKARIEEPREYVIEKEHIKEARKIAALEKELRAHEKMPMDRAHPQGGSQKDAPLPSMRKY